MTRDSISERCRKRNRDAGKYQSHTQSARGRPNPLTLLAEETRDRNQAEKQNQPSQQRADPAYPGPNARLPGGWGCLVRHPAGACPAPPAILGHGRTPFAAVPEVLTVVRELRHPLQAPGDLSTW